MKDRDFPPIHPGEILSSEFLEPYQLAPNHLAKDTGIPVRRVLDIVRGRRAITADTALRLARYFGNSTEFWLNLQSHYDLQVALEQIGDRLEQEVKPLATRHTIIF
ncbi:MAG: antitoxin HigA [Pseudomonadota bacterium]|nr:antitoxin HigA [Pseudomonadota bacterium]